MRKEESNDNYAHVRKELNREKKISFIQVILIIVLLILGVLLSLFSDDNSHLAVWIRELFNKQ